MLIIFFDIKRIVHKEFVLAGQTVNYSISRTTVVLYVYCLKICEDFTQKFRDKITGCCIIATHIITLPVSPGNF
jgi:hypothetical protein